MGRNKRESVMPVRVDRLLSDESMGDMTGVFMSLVFEEDVQGVDRYGVTLLSRRMASSYANRPGSLLPKSPRGVGEMNSALLPSTTLPVELDAQGVETMGRGYARAR